MIRLDLLGEKLDGLDVKITQYVNDNIKEIIRVLIDYLEDNNDFSIIDVVPQNKYNITNEEWLRMVYDLYDIICSSVLRDYIKPQYQYLLYLILSWWQECFEEDMELLPISLEDTLAYEIGAKYPGEDGKSYVLRAITTYEEYYYILFPDHDFLSDSLERMVTIYLRSHELFNKLS